MLLESSVAHPVGVEEAARLARDLYGLDVTAKSLPGEYDDNFHLTAADGVHTCRSTGWAGSCRDR